MVRVAKERTPFRVTTEQLGEKRLVYRPKHVLVDYINLDYQEYLGYQMTRSICKEFRILRFSETKVRGRNREEEEEEEGGSLALSGVRVS